MTKYSTKYSSKYFCRSLLGGGLLFALAVPAAGPAAAVGGSCPTTKAKFVQETSKRQTSKTGYINLAGTSVTITLNGPSNGCAIVSFTAQAFTAPNGTLMVRPTIEGEPSALPNEVALIPPSQTSFATSTANFVFTDIPPGTYQIRMQYMSAGGGVVSVFKSNVIVNYTD